jgi:hypothetical protein
MMRCSQHPSIGSECSWQLLLYLRPISNQESACQGGKMCGSICWVLSGEHGKQPPSVTHSRTAGAVRHAAAAYTTDC